MFVSRFKSFAPPYKVNQELALKWLGQAHSRHASDGRDWTKLIERFGCGPERIKTRSSFLKDFTHQDWPSMQLFAARASLEERMAIFNRALAPAVSELFTETNADFKNLIHVTCTGYVSPSVAQVLLSERGWDVECLHAYHMGCYASLPALRMARGNLDSEILHTELCTLHFDPSNHDPEQLVIQSLFADGMIRYRVSADEPDSGFKVDALREVIAPKSLQSMTWEVASAGFKMTLGREVPKAVESSVEDLVGAWRSKDAVYAIHPGGPRIIDAVKDALGLSEEQVFFSREVLREHGNMSSATLPHVWQKMLPELKNGTPVISMAFGPGLTLSASLMSKAGHARN